MKLPLVHPSPITSSSFALDPHAGHGATDRGTVFVTMLQKMELNAEKFVDSLGPVSEIV